MKTAYSNLKIRELTGDLGNDVFRFLVDNDFPHDYSSEAFQRNGERYFWHTRSGDTGRGRMPYNVAQQRYAARQSAFCCGQDCMGSTGKSSVSGGNNERI